jgi:hypothetical protein
MYLQYMGLKQLKDRIIKGIHLDWGADEEFENGYLNNRFEAWFFSYYYPKRVGYMKLAPFIFRQFYLFMAICLMTISAVAPYLKKGYGYTLEDFSFSVLYISSSLYFTLGWLMMKNGTKEITQQRRLFKLLNEDLKKTKLKVRVL